MNIFNSILIFQCFPQFPGFSPNVFTSNGTTSPIPWRTAHYIVNEKLKMRDLIYILPLFQWENLFTHIFFLMALLILVN